jgi:hypothetical protein
LNKKLKVIFDLYFVNPQDIFYLMDKIFIQTIFKAEINKKVLIINFGLIHLFNLWFLVELLTKLFDWLTSKAVAHHTKASFIRVVGSEFVQKYLGEWSETCFVWQKKILLQSFLLMNTPILPKRFV